MLLHANLYLILQWYVSTVTIPKLVLLIIHSTNGSMKSLMKLTSILLLESLSHSDYIMVYVSNVNCTENVVSANSSQRQLLEHCVHTQLDVAVVDINPNALYNKFHR